MTFSRHFCPDQLTVFFFFFFLHTLYQHIRSSFGFSILPKHILTCRPGELNQQPSVNKTPALPPSHSPPEQTSGIQELFSQMESTKTKICFTLIGSMLNSKQRAQTLTLHGADENNYFGNVFGPVCFHI